MIQKSRTFRAQRNLTSFFEERFWSQESLDDFYDQLGNDPDGAMAKVFSVGMLEWRMASSKGVSRSLGRELRTSLVGRIEKSMSLVISKEMDGLEKGIPFSEKSICHRAKLVVEANRGELIGSRQYGKRY